MSEKAQTILIQLCGDLLEKAELEVTQEVRDELRDLVSCIKALVDQA